ncbi:EamA/RhaT family transporter [Neobacillus piezotolerans]|uniref:EamA/RhaT family transporter n=1 Tax=Neobacillus piezotolerans TaxID=2259171 RepID=A0A3D8GQ51_9BACI|nr:DMT family transporter [Neobacillus piezotolerans]RDU36411.1 EamA/RhaT family transporter [Neobacillus piezotolerans]
MNRSRHILADSVLLFVTFIWGITFVMIQNAISSLEPFSFNGVRFLTAALLLAIWLLLADRKQLSLVTPRLILSGAFLGLFLFVGYASQTAGLLYTTSSKAGFITGLSVVLVPLFSFLLMKQQPGRNAVIGVLVATVGLFLLTMTGVSPLNKGDGLVFICAIGFALHILFTGKYSSLYPSLLLTIVQIATVGILSSVSALFFENWQKAFQPEIIFSSEVLIALLVTSLFATAIAFLAQTAFQKHTSATRVALIFAMEPVFAAGAGYFWAGDILTISALAGCLFIFLGMVISELPPRQKKLMEIPLNVEKPGA